MPHRFEDLIFGNKAAGPLYQKYQQVKCPWGKRHWLAVAQQEVLRGVKTEATKLE